MRKSAAFALTVTFVSLLGGPMVWAQEYDDKEHAELGQALKDAKVTLAKGLLASERKGKPISGKFEIEDRKLQLSVYIMKGGKFSEVIVGHKTGKVAKVEAITGGEDLTAAKAQSEAMAKARRSLRAVVDATVKATKGYRAVSVTPALKDGHPVADVVLVEDNQWKTVSQKLD